ncbi:MAG TPA: YifB family Mg chelatase-like AAA ATPase [Gemmatimonadales bacterium]|nr:YifB family Mg chelatase-like AAA ATPase [Gemmatimonadales bacterium]
MPLARVMSCAVVGLEGSLIEVEVDVSRAGQPSMAIVGLPDMAVNESKERVRSAIRNSGGAIPQPSRIVVNLAPADLRKEGPAYDLPIALGLLAATDQIHADMSDTVFLGELGLDGAVRHTNGVLAMVAMARERGIKRVYVPAEDAPEAALIGGVEVLPVTTLRQLVMHLNGHPVAEGSIVPYVAEPPGEDEQDGHYPVDMSHIKGQEHVKRALEVAASGGHNLLMSGPPGSGKTLLARCTPTILPSMTTSEMLEVTKIYSIAGMLPSDQPLIRHRPFRAPHHTVSHAGLVGGGRVPRPGEITLAHRGVLFLDEFPEYTSQALETLRQPLEDRIVTITRVSGSLTYPANFVLIAAMNPCPCGYYGDPVKQCTCTSSIITRYQKRISGPLLDRIDIHVEVPRVEYEKLSDNRAGETSAAIRARVEAARRRQRERFAHTEGVTCNSEMRPAEIRDHCELDAAGQSLIKAAMRQLNLSARAYHRILKLSRTIADLAGSDRIEAAHLAEAVQYRPRQML